MRPALLLALGCTAALATERPIIGILPMPNTAYSASLGASFFPASYVKFLESGGARVVPIPFDLPPASLAALLSQINGALFTGGASSFWAGGPPKLSQYAATAQAIYRTVEAAAAAGETWPLWGTCLGHELIAILGSNLNQSVLTPGWDSENLTEAVAWAPAGGGSRLWGRGSPAPAAAAAASFAALPIAMNAHTQGVAPGDFAASALSDTFDLLGTGVDRGGKTFVASMEGKTLPIYTTQWHPEKVMYEWAPPDAATAHSYEAVVANTWPAWFFAAEARKNTRGFADPGQEAAALIYNFDAKPGVSSMFVRARRLWLCTTRAGLGLVSPPARPSPTLAGANLLFPRLCVVWGSHPQLNPGPSNPHSKKKRAGFFYL